MERIRTRDLFGELRAARATTWPQGAHLASGETADDAGTTNVPGSSSVVDALHPATPDGSFRQAR